VFAAALTTLVGANVAIKFGPAHAGLVVGLVPATRVMFLDNRYHLPAGSAVLTALVVIPLGTVLVEEIAFRGVLAGLLRHHHGWWWATGTSSVLFGLWHILPSSSLNRHNRAAGAILGTGADGQVAVIVGAVAFTALAGVVLCELRRRSGSLLASAGLHWASNAVGVLLAATLWATHP
jgi:membrane protease YdiL (CAAX protease family)